MDLYWFFAGATFIFGLAFGSFLNVCIYRLPRGMSVVTPSRSFCPNCQHQIAGYDNIPVVSWLLLRGRCRNCHQPINPRYAIIELLTGLLFLVCFITFGGASGLAFKNIVFCFLVLGLIFTDAETHLLPDKMTLTGTVAGLVIALLVPMQGILEEQYASGSAFASVWHSPRLLSLADSCLGALVGAGSIFLVAEVYFRIRRFEGMGLGDVKLMALIGSFLGIRLTVFVLFAASFTGAIYGTSILASIYRKRRIRLQRFPDGPHRAWKSTMLAMRFIEMPFGVFLGGMALVALFYGDIIIAWYFRLFT